MSTDRFCDLVRELTRGKLKEKEFLTLFMVEFQCTWGAVLRALGEHDAALARQLAERIQANLPDSGMKVSASLGTKKSNSFEAVIARVCEKRSHILQREIRLLEMIARAESSCKASELISETSLHEARISPEGIIANLSRLAAVGVIAVPRKGRYVSTVHTEAYIAALKNELALRSGTENKVK